ncbi:uncharacterized protein FIBRA_09408 [Fibroporia radiculosa]|uniref:Uncharacterized protein n=1 Tax=Fibroporia radiculosa TaxID=599839 RepID=J7SD07_9APHY|nr:uncharacterized protein FIBRA_09408 [Fibroporia radiculosa]CCM07083.1 predicted protein [Fibroporia radiculosa]
MESLEIGGLQPYLLTRFEYWIGFLSEDALAG